jgi:peptidoglycan/LPS O-acetylase OafA/YrhL
MREKLHTLTGLRFLAAVWVICGHFAPLTVLPRPLAVVLASNAFAVSFFFVLSGFVLTYAAAVRSRPARSFYAGRVRRLGPIYVLALGLGLLPFVWSTAVGSVQDHLGTALTTITLTQAWFPQWMMIWDPPAWSLSCEAFFYLLFPLILRGIVPLRRPGLFAMALLCWLLSIIPVALLPAQIWDANVALRNFVSYAPLTRLPEFVLGIVTARVFLLGGKANPWQRRAWEMLGTGMLIALPFIILLTKPLFATRVASHMVPLPLLGLLAPCFALLILALAQAPGPIGLLLAQEPFRVLGEASYALYLLHYPLWDLLNHTRNTARERASIYLLLCHCSGRSMRRHHCYLTVEWCVRDNYRAVGIRRGGIGIGTGR